MESNAMVCTNAMVCSDACFMRSFWQTTVESDIQTKIMEFAAMTMGKVYFFHKLANNRTKYSTRIQTQQTPYGTELQRNITGAIDDTSGA